MADWTDISDLWWLQPKRESGRALQGLALGAQIAQNRTENEWRQQQAQVLMDQRRAAMQTQEAKVRGIAAMSSYMADVAARNAWTDPAAKAGFYRLGAQYPQAIDDPTLQAMARNFEMAEAREAQARQHATTPAMTELTAADRWEQIAQQMESLGPLDEEMSKQVSNLRQRAVLLRGRQLAPTETIETLPEGGFRITRGPATQAKPGELTIATRTKRQQDLMGYADVAETLAYINKHKDASDFGVRGQFKELYARVAGQLGIEVPPGTVSTRAAVTTLRSALIKTLRSDSNIAEAERRELERAVPSTRDLTESFPTAVDKLNEAARNILGRSRRAAEDLQISVPPWVATPQELGERFKKGEYGDPTSQAAKDKLAQDLRRYHGFD